MVHRISGPSHPNSLICLFKGVLIISTHETDILIVGSGIAGSLIAWKLASKGQKVTILEAGPRIDRNETVEQYRASVNKGDFMAPYPGTSYAPNAKPDSDYIIEKGTQPYGTQYIRGVGGTTWHWAAATWRFLPTDFRLKTAYGVGRNWPLSYDDLEPYYQLAEEALGVAGPDPKDEDLGSPRSAAYPMKALPLSYMDQQFSKILNSSGFDVVTEPVARNYETYDNRPACCGNNNCMPICPIGAQYSGDMHAVKAEAAGAKLIVNAVVYHIDIDTNGKHITGVRYKSPDGAEHRISAKTVVLAANGIETPKLMLLSASATLPNGIGNSSNMVGRNLMDHPGTGITFLWGKPVFPGRGPQEMTSVVNFRDGAFRSNYAAKKLHLGNMADYEGVSEHLIDAGLMQPELDQKIREQVARKVSINCFHEQLPDPDNRIIPSATMKDAIGIPRPEITYSIGDYVQDSARHTHETYARIATLLGGTEIVHNDKFAPNNHIMGTTIMGDDPRDSVVDKQCRTHDHPNLYIAGSSVFASAACVNATLTIAALALRTADAIASDNS